MCLRVNALFLGALYPSKSGLMNKHIVKHIVRSVPKCSMPFMHLWCPVKFLNKFRNW